MEPNPELLRPVARRPDKAELVAAGQRRFAELRARRTEKHRTPLAEVSAGLNGNSEADVPAEAAVVKHGKEAVDAIAEEDGTSEQSSASILSQSSESTLSQSSESALSQSTAAAAAQLARALLQEQTGTLLHEDELQLMRDQVEALQAAETALLSELHAKRQRVCAVEASLLRVQREASALAEENDMFRSKLDRGEAAAVEASTEVAPRQVEAELRERIAQLQAEVEHSRGGSTAAREETAMARKDTIAAHECADFALAEAQSARENLRLCEELLEDERARASAALGAHTEEMAARESAEEALA